VNFPEFQNLSGGFEVTLIGPGKSFEEEIEKEKFHKLEINERQEKAIKYVIDKGSINRREYMRLNQISHTIAHRELKELVGKGVFKKKGAGKYIRYELTQG
jgi:ATP-dependent DNA helicase RecG